MNARVGASPGTRAAARVLTAGFLIFFPLYAQIDAASPSITVNLAGKWRYRPGDNPAWAQPGFDDSGWAQVSVPAPLGGQGFAHLGYGWYRVRVRGLPEGKWALVLNRPGATGYNSFGRDSWEAYVNGCRIGGWGPMGRASDDPARPDPMAAPIPPQCIAGQRDALLAVRLWRRPPAASIPVRSLGGIQNAPVLLVPEGRVKAELRAIAAAEAVANIPRFFLYLICTLVALFALRLFWLEPRRREFLWFAIYLLTQASRTLVSISEYIWGAASTPLLNIVVTMSQFLGPVAGIELAAALYAIELPRWARAVEGAVVLMGLAATAGVLSTSRAGLLADLVFLVFLLLLMRWGSRRGGWAVNGALVLIVAPQVLVFFDQSFNQFVPFLLPLDTRFMVGPMIVNLHYPSLLLFMGAMLGILTRRYAQDASERQRLGGELEAARTVQQLLLREPGGELSSFAVECRYQPAAEVGGDFYWHRVAPDGSLLVVVGDVSGKGLKAALLVSVVIGVLRNEKSLSPAAILSALNEALLGHTAGGFVTCCCARFGLDGTVTLANAGHPAPYADGREVTVEAGLPLGVVPDLACNESEARGSSFVFVSDGVLEAARENGELFGFDRTREISTKPASEIAETARKWGQNDDITVVTVRRTR